ncbi:hypothetical protein [Treponema sp.]|uniref:hypothetical protein n=1 Tax=Treponema sp. TaxID=166 RepID=UPI003F0DE20E
MNRSVSFLDGILAMKDSCPANGSASISYAIHNGKICSVRFSRTEELFTEERNAENAVFTEKIEGRILSDLESIRMQFGTITVSIDASHGALKSYSLIPCSTLNANLLKAQIESRSTRLAAKQNQADRPELQETI